VFNRFVTRKLSVSLVCFFRAPLVATLPAGATLIATNVICFICGADQDFVHGGFRAKLFPVVLYQVTNFVAPGQLLA
jgi:Sec-independent protein secretion pathway component TatC